MAQKPPSYANVERLLFRGFLDAKVDMAGIPVVLKTLTQTEFDLVSLQGEDLSKDWRLHSGYYLAYSTLFFNRQPMLHIRDSWVPSLAELYADLPESVLVGMLQCVNRLNAESREALYEVQAYAYGPASRERWHQLRGVPMCDTRLTGIRGTDAVGLNYHQRLWSYLNRHEDNHELYMREYNLAKFMTSPHAPKEIQRMDRKDTKRIKDIDRYRKKIHMGRDAALGDDDRDIRVAAESAEELLEQMEKHLRGEKDHHDLVIEQHQRRVREAYLQREAERARMARIAAEKRQAAMEREITDKSIAGLTRAEVEHLIQKNNEEAAQIRESSTWVDPDYLVQQESRLLKFGFLESEDIPEARRSWYQFTGGTERQEESENPLMKDHYQRVSPDREDT